MRRGVVAAGLSVLAHAALVVAAVVVLRSPAKRAGVAEVRFGVEAVAAPKAAPGPAAEAEAPRVAPAARPRVKKARAVRTAPAAGTETEAESDTDTDSESDTDTDSDSSSAMGGIGEGKQETGDRQQETGDRPDGERVRLAIERVVTYPRLAKRQGLEGRVVVRFRIDEAGRPQEVQIVESSGTILDDAAREAVARAAPYAPTPGWVRVPVDFSLRRAR